MDEYITCLDTSHQNQSWVRFVIRDNDKVNSNEKGLSSIIDSFYDSGSGFFIYDDESFTNDNTGTSNDQTYNHNTYDGSGSYSQRYHSRDNS